MVIKIEMIFSNYCLYPKTTFGLIILHKFRSFPSIKCLEFPTIEWEEFCVAFLIKVQKVNSFGHLCKMSKCILQPWHFLQHWSENTKYILFRGSRAQNPPSNCFPLIFPPWVCICCIRIGIYNLQPVKL